MRHQTRLLLQTVSLDQLLLLVSLLLLQLRQSAVRRVGHLANDRERPMVTIFAKILGEKEGLKKSPGRHFGHQLTHKGPKNI
jgi:hypothetical protein